MKNGILQNACCTSPKSDSDLEKKCSYAHRQVDEQPRNSINDSGDFQDVESKICGRLSHVSSQLVMIPSSRSMLSRDKRLPLDTCNQSGLQDNVFGNQSSTFDSPRDHLQFHLMTWKETEKQFLWISSLRSKQV